MVIAFKKYQNIVILVKFIATSHDLTQKVAKEGKSPHFRET